jgi:hypothetical protein
VLDVELEGMWLRDWPFRDLRLRHAVDLVDHMLRHQGRAHTGVQNILRSLSAMSEDAITDEIAEVNFVRGVRVRANDPRVRGETRPARVFGFDELRRFAAQGGEHEPMLCVFADCGLRLGEVLGLECRDFDGETLHLRGSAHARVFTPGDQPTKRHVRTVPCPPSTAHLIRAMPTRIDTPLLFPTPAGRIWHESNFRRDVWIPALPAHLGIVCEQGSRRGASRGAAGSRSRRQGGRSGRTTAATPGSPTCAPPASTTPTWSRSLATPYNDSIGPRGGRRAVIQGVGRRARPQSDRSGERTDRRP